MYKNLWLKSIEKIREYHLEAAWGGLEGLAPVSFLVLIGCRMLGSPVRTPLRITVDLWSSFLPPPPLLPIFWLITLCDEDMWVIRP